jgi:hypothetical protein
VQLLTTAVALRVDKFYNYVNVEPTNAFNYNLLLSFHKCVSLSKNSQSKYVKKVFFFGQTIAWNKHATLTKP